MDRYEITQLYEEGVTLEEMFSQDDEIGSFLESYNHQNAEMQHS